MGNVIFGRKNIIKELGDPVILVKNASHDSLGQNF